MYWFFIIFSTIIISIRNIVSIFIEKNSNFLYFLSLIIYLLYWYKIIKKSSYLKSLDVNFLKFSFIFWIIFLLCNIMMFFWQSYEVYFPLFSPFIIFSYSLLWGLSFLSNDFRFLLFINYIISLFFIYISKRYLIRVYKEDNK